MLSGTAAAAINHLLRDAGWARERLISFAGRSVQFEIPPVRLAFSIDPDGYLVAVEPQDAAAALVRCSAPALIRLIGLHDESARQDLHVEGDSALASAFTSVLSGLRWDIEEDLSRIVGDVAARRLTQAGSGLLAWHAQAASNLAQALAEYWTGERPLLVGRDALGEFVRAVDALRDDAQRLEKRIERLENLRPQRAGA